ncbi:MAG: MFS transporter [Chloroflexota bacterium]
MTSNHVSLWRHADFMRLWAGQTTSLLGSQITLLALPLVAVLFLDATPIQMGILTAVGSLPSLLIGLFVGVWVDRRRRRPILIMADLGRAILLLIIPITAWFSVLRIEHLYILAFLIGILTLFFDVAYRSLLPALINTDRLVEGNSKLELSQSAAEVIGPGVAGGLVQLVTAPFAIIVDAFSFLLSGLFLSLIKKPETPPEASSQKSLWQEAREGLQIVFGTPILRAIAGSLGTLSLFNSMLETVFVLYITRDLALTPGLIGLIFSSGGIGFLIGALLPEWNIRRFGLGTTMIGAILITGFSDLLIALAGGSTLSIVIILIVAQFLFGLGLTNYNVGQVSLRQAITPEPLQGRMNAMMRLISWGIIPLGALLGGVLGETIGLRATIGIAALGEISAILWLLLSPVRSIQEPPADSLA